MTTASRRSRPHSTARWAPPGGWLRSWRTTSSPTAACGSPTHWFHSSAPSCWSRRARPSHPGCHVGEGGASRLERDTSGPRGEADRVIPPAQHREVQYLRDRRTPRAAPPTGRCRCLGNRRARRRRGSVGDLAGWSSTGRRRRRGSASRPGLRRSCALSAKKATCTPHSYSQPQRTQVRSMTISRSRRDSDNARLSS